jgi:hypothetical protein
MPTVQKDSIHLPILREMFPKQLNLFIPDAAAVIGWAAGSLRNNLRSSRPILRAVKIGRNRMVPLVTLAAYLDGLTDVADTKPMGRPRKSGGAV